MPNTTTYLIEWLKFKRLTAANVVKDVEELPVECGMTQPFWKPVWQFLKKLNIHPPYELDVPL